MEPAEQAEAKRSLASKGIYWYPVNWPAGTTVANKIKGIRSVITTGITVCRRHRPRLIHSRSSLPVFAAVTLSKLFRTKFLYDADSLLSEEYLDVGHVTRDSRGYKFLAWSEKWARKNADHIIVLTERLRDVYLKDFRVTVTVDVIPCCVDTDVFSFDPEARKRLRNDLGTNDDLLFVYVGKVGSWYVVDETFELFKAINEVYPASRLLIISRDGEDVFREIAKKVGVAEYL
jgi:glycosyltransferase involved in cell wall biosynthesis